MAVLMPMLLLPAVLLLLWFLRWPFLLSGGVSDDAFTCAKPASEPSDWEDGIFREVGNGLTRGAQNLKCYGQTRPEQGGGLRRRDDRATLLAVATVLILFRAYSRSKL